MTKTCEYCGLPFEAKHKKAKFCNDNCKMNFHRNGAVEPNTVAAEVAKQTMAPKDVKDIVKNLPPWIKKVEEFCEKQGCTPEDLIEHFKGKNVKRAPSLADVLIVESRSKASMSYIEQRREGKLK